MRLDHLVIHTSNDAKTFQALSETINAQGYPFDPKRGKYNHEIHINTINVGNEYIELVRLKKPHLKSWMPLWSHFYDQGQRGAYCIFLEVEDAERLGVALKHAGIKALGPAMIPYPSPLHIFHIESPYFVYFLPSFPNTALHLAIMQYHRPGRRQGLLDGLGPNAEQNGIHGIRRVEVELPNLDESMPMLQMIFSDLHLEGGDWADQLEKTRMIFRRSPDENAHVCVKTVTSQRANIGKRFQIDNVEVITTGG